MTDAELVIAIKAANDALNIISVRDILGRSVASKHLIALQEIQQRRARFPLISADQIELYHD